MAELLFRQGLVTQLFNAQGVAQHLKEGSLNFTTDEPAIYIDVKDGDNVVRKRIGDIKEFSNVDAIKAYLASTTGAIPTSGLYYAIEENVLMKYNPAAKEGEKWQQINLTKAEVAAIRQSISNLGTTVDDLAKRIEAVEGVNKDILEKYLTVEAFETFEGKLNTTLDGLRTDVDDAADVADQALELANANKTAHETYVGEHVNDYNNGTIDNMVKVAKDAADAAQKTADDYIAAHTNDYTNTQIDEKVADAKSAGTDAQTTIGNYITDHADDYTNAQIDAAVKAAKDVADAALPKAGGTVTGTITLDAGGKITGVANPSVDADAANKGYVDGVVSNLQTAHNELSGKAVLKDGSVAMAGNLNLNKNKIVDLADPAAEGDAVNKKYVDGINTALGGRIDGVSDNFNTLSGTVGDLSKTVSDNKTAADEAIGTINAWIANTGATKEYVNTENANQTTAITTAYQAYVDEKLQTADAMKFKGVVSSADDLNANATQIEAGWTYKASVAFKIGTTQVYVGDLLIANADASEAVVYPSIPVIGNTGATWSHISSGYEDKNATYLTHVANSKTIVLDDIAEGNRGQITFNDTDNIKSIVTATTNEVTGISNINVSFGLEWVTFDTLSND